MQWILSHRLTANAVGIVCKLNMLVSILFARLSKLFDINSHISWIYIGNSTMFTTVFHATKSVFIFLLSSYALLY